MTDSQRNTIQDALDKMGLALADHEHTWTDDERLAYEQAVDALAG